MTSEIRQEICPACGCRVTSESAYQKEGVTYCCQPCAEGENSACECGCGEAQAGTA